MKQEQIMQMQLIQQEAEQYNQQIQLIDQHIKEMQEIGETLEEVERKDCKKILANLGKKIYLPVEIEKKELIVEVGDKKLVKKSLKETKELVQQQLVKLVAAKGELSDKMEELQERLVVLLNSVEEEQKKEKGKG
jgi:prefoldin alpha subunit